ncbi:MAG TPA: HPr family phosphocarrier protein [Bacteroidetes bacterium]|nr:MAG: HPr family phosphocarrier protein [Rhodothermaceae bacterium TMED105]HBW00033.1 HPr family phosphocarrier protein [Bacteroidota bacterium]|tara:strand:- start:353 stop:625 length:273 start_codon:yes stop_codon:yes gene_type:complete
MIEKMVTVGLVAGLHARPSAALVREASKFDSELTLELYGFEVNGKSILGIMTLAAVEGAEIKLICEGTDEQAMMDHLVDQFERNFYLEEA